MIEGKTNILFGKIVDVLDSDKLYRCKVSIGGYTDLINKDDLPWYFPWYGVNYLPQINDIVPVMIFDQNIVTGFYGKKINEKSSEVSDDDYETYLEIFKRLVDDEKVELTYKKTTGIEFINSKSKVQIEIDKITFFIESNSILISKDKIMLGDKNQEASLLGDKSVKHLENIIKHQNNTIIEMMKLFNAIQSAAMTVPYTMTIGGALIGMIPASNLKLTKENAELVKEVKKIQSKKVFIE